MKWSVAVGLLLFGAMLCQAQAAKPCEELKDEIAKKLDAKGVVSYTLDIVDKDKEVTDGKVVGTCGGGTKKIIYNRGTKPAEAPAPVKDEKKS